MSLRFVFLIPLVTAGSLTLESGTFLEQRHAHENGPGYSLRPVTQPVSLAECPYWDDETNTILFVDVAGQLVLRYDPANPNDLKSVYLSNGRTNPAVPLAGTGKILAGAGRDLVLLDIEWGAPGTKATIKSSRVLFTVDQDKPGNRFNDGKADREGRILIGTMSDNLTSRSLPHFGGHPGWLFDGSSSRNSGQGSLYQFITSESTNGEVRVDTCTTLLGDLEVPNGLVWIPQRDNVFSTTLYFVDSGKGSVFSFDYDSRDGKLSHQRTVFNFKESGVPGSPDGMTIDVDGNLWVACVHGGQVIRVDPRTGRLLQTVSIPAKAVTAAEWGGVDKDILYVTTSRFNLGEEELQQQPLAGSLFEITGLGTRGFRQVPYRARALATPRERDSIL